MIRLLLLTCGTNACFHIAKTLKEKFPADFVIIGTDINKKWEIASCNYLDAFYRSPYSSDPSYYDFILNICKNEKIDYLLPSFDCDQFLFYPENKDLHNLNVKSLGVSKKTIDCFYTDKNKVNDFYARNGIPVPKTYNFNQLEADKEYFIKPKNGVGSVGAKKASKKDILDDTYLIQEVCEPPEITLECFYDGKRLATVARKRIEAKNGVCTKAKLFHSEKLENIARRITTLLPLPYCFNFQFMKNTKGDFVVTDTNLRFAGGMSLSYCAGWDEVSAVAKILLNRPNIFETLENIAGEKYVVRAYTDILTKTTRKKIAFDLDGTLLDSRKRHSFVMDDVLKKFGINIDTSDLVSFKSKGKNNVDFLCKKGLEKTLAEQIQKQWIQNIENEHYLKNDILYENVFSMLSKLSKNNDLYLLTARQDECAAIKQIKTLGIYDFFEEVIVVSPANASENKSRKLTENNISEFIGDTISDYNAAKSSGIDFYAVRHGFNDFSSIKGIIFFDEFDL